MIKWFLKFLLSILLFFQSRRRLRLLYLSPFSRCSAPFILPVFLHVSVVDIDQLKLIMMLVGTPGPEFLMKISSESVSVKYHPTQFCYTTPPACVCIASVLLWQKLGSLLLYMTTLFCIAITICSCFASTTSCNMLFTIYSIF